MTTYNKSTLGVFFQTGDVPQGSDYQNLIDSQVNIVETSVQAMGGPLSVPELIASRISAGIVNVTGSLTFNGTVSAPSIQTASLRASAASFSTASAATLTVNRLTITSLASAKSNLYVNGEFIRPVANYIAAGTTQATATPVSAAISYLTGVVDGATTGYILMANKTGLIQYIYNQNTVSANLWPCVGGQINVLSSNAAFGMAASTMYTVVHIRASGYAVK